MSLFFLAFCIAIVRLTTAEYCSAFQSYVEVTISSSEWPSTYIYILLSSQALFPPHIYYIPHTSLVSLSNTESICDSNLPLSINITNKVILLFESAGNCSIHQQVLFAQRYGAIAVLMTSDDSSENVVNIVDDNSLSHLDTVIPMRSITKIDGKWLRRKIETDVIQVLVKYGCYSNTLYPSILCLRDNTGQFWTLNGEYEKQPYLEINDHPVWKLNRYHLYLDPLYIFLHDANGDADWFWAITSDALCEDDTALMLRCAISGITDPSLCPSWSAIDDTGLVLTINITTDVCPATQDMDICIHSHESQPVGTGGTYSLAHNGVAVWIRDLTECDRRARVLIFKESGNYTGSFVLYDPLQDIVSAYCILPTEWSDNGTYITSRYIPNICTEWKQNDDIKYDIIFNISLNICTHTSNVNCISSEAPDTVCMTDNSNLHGYLMGEYTKLNTVGPHFGSPIYKRIPYDDVYGSNNELYIWYSDELFATVDSMDLQDIQEQSWYLTDYTLESASTAADSDTYSYYGHCEGYSFGNPANCVGWIFEDGLRHMDEDMSVIEGQCTEYVLPQLPESWPQYVCIDLKNDTFDTDLKNDTFDTDLAVFVGKYEIDMYTIDDDIPTWNKQNDDMYIWYSDDKSWSVSDWNQMLYYDELNISNGFEIRCDSYYRAHSLNPIDCKTWLNVNDDILDDIYLYDCTERKRLEMYDMDKWMEMIGVIVVGIGCIAAVVLLCIMWKKKRKGISPQKLKDENSNRLDKDDDMNLEKTDPVTLPQTLSLENVNMNIEL